MNSNRPYPFFDEVKNVNLNSTWTPNQKIGFWDGLAGHNAIDWIKFYDQAVSNRYVQAQPELNLSIDRNANLNPILELFLFFFLSFFLLKMITPIL